MLTMSSHKIHGPKGVGAIFIKDKTKIQPIALGGGQQKGMRSGTENVPGIAGMAMAAVSAPGQAVCRPVHPRPTV